MKAVKGFTDLNGLKVMFAAGPLWPNPANIFAIPDGRGFTMIDVGSGGVTGRDYLLNGLNHLASRSGISIRSSFHMPIPIIWVRCNMFWKRSIPGS